MRMTIPRRLSLGTAALAAGLLAAVAAARPAIAAPGQDATGLATQAARKSLLLFPVDVSATAVPNKDEVSAILTDVVSSRLDASGVYSVTRFSRALPTVARLHMDQLLTDADVQAPFSEGNRKAIKVSKEAGYDVAFVGSLDSYEYNEADKQVTLVVAGRIVEAQTGNVVKNVIINTNSPKGGAGKEDEIALAAARSAGEQLMTRLAPTVVRPVTPTTQPNTTPGRSTGERKARKARTDWLWGVLAVGLGLGIGLSSSGGHGGGGGGGGGDTPPPPPR